MRKSPPGSCGGSPHTMTAPPNPFAIAPPAAHTTTLGAPTLPPTNPRSPVYSSNSYSHSNSPSTASGGLPEVQSHDTSGLVISPAQISSASLNAQKRAYRQRRKDPSCDACRERKVKCDATETSACSECSSRNHKCQFTKETNRRMSSIKQVQDLQSQIVELTQLNTHLRTKALDGGRVDVERPEIKRRHSDAQDQIPAGSHRILAPVMNNFDHVRDNIRKHSQGIFNTPHVRSTAPAFAGLGSALPEIPLRADFARHSRSYLASFHEWYPVFHWPTFQSEVDEAYATRNFEGMSREWIGLFHAVMACGSLQAEPLSEGVAGPKPRAMAYFDAAVQSFSPWPQEVIVMHAQIAFLLSIFAEESNLRSVGSMWLGCAVRVAQELKAYCEINFRSLIDAETRRRLWWAIYVRDRITSIDSNRPMLINEDDCEISLPSLVEDRYIQPQGFYRPHATSAPIIGSLAVIQITRLHAQLYQALKSSVISPQALQSFDEQFRAKESLLPDAYRTDSNTPLEVAALLPLLTLLSARYHLYRRNFTPVCHPAERAEALSRCICVAQDTAKYISRTLHSPPELESEKNWQIRVAPIASNMICMHLWRCILVLCFRGDCDAALICVHLSGAIGNTRKINVECGKNTIFFLDRMLDRVRSGRGSPQQLEHDEEMLAYVSGDVQGSLEHSWVWAGTDLTSPAYSHRSPADATAPRGPDEPMHDALPLRVSGGSPKDGVRLWGEWAITEHMIRQLMEENRLRTAQPPTYYPPPHNPMKRVQLAPDTHPSPQTVPTSKPTPSSTSRISIANII